MRSGLRGFLAAILAVLALSSWGWAEPVKVDVRDGERLSRAVQTEMIHFIQQNYPGHLKSVMRSLQSDESRLRRDLTDNVQFLRGFARGPVTFEGVFREIRGAARYVLLSTLHGVEGYPNATICFETYPGAFRPVTDVQVDEDGDGTVDERSTGICRWQGVWKWLEVRLPRRNSRLALCPQRNYSPLRTPDAVDGPSRLGT